MVIHKLNPRKVASAAPGKYEDGGGLRLVVSNAGARKWVLRFTINGKRREMGLGSFPDVELGEARSKASDCRKLAKEGIDPLRHVGQSQEQSQPSQPVQLISYAHIAGAGKTQNILASGSALSKPMHGL